MILAVLTDDIDDYVLGEWLEDAERVISEQDVELAEYCEVGEVGVGLREVH